MLFRSRICIQVPLKSTNVRHTDRCLHRRLLNTVAQIVYATVVLAALTFGWEIALVKDMLMGVVAALTLLSIGFYVAAWIRHMNVVESKY